MKAVKKPIPIEVEEFQPDRLPWPAQLRAASVEGCYDLFNELHGSWIRIKPGDYVNVTDKSGRDIYPIDRETFERTYEIVAGD